MFALEKEFQDKVASRQLANAAKKLISWLCEIANGSGMDFSAEIWLILRIRALEGVLADLDLRSTGEADISPHAPGKLKLRTECHCWADPLGDCLTGFHEPMNILKAQPWVSSDTRPLISAFAHRFPISGNILHPIPPTKQNKKMLLHSWIRGKWGRGIWLQQKEQIRMLLCHH